MRLSELKRVIKRMSELGIDPATTTVNDIWEIVVTFKRGQIC